jgi:hypothetical protein
LSFLSSLLLLLAGFSLYWNFVRLRPSDYLNVPEAQVLRESCISQKREWSQKDLWIPKQNERTHLSLVCEESELFLKSRTKKIEAVETMKNLVCTQGANRLSAAEGVYSYRSRQMNLKNMQGHLRTSAREADLSAESAEFTPLHCKATGSVSITTSDFFTAQGDSLDYSVADKFFLLSKSSPGYCAFSHAEETFALADQCSYSLNTEIAFLESLPTRRVLFWQKEGSRSLSAPQIKIRLNPQEVEAFGDAHCTFNSEEQNLLKSFFSKHL